MRHYFQKLEDGTSRNTWGWTSPRNERQLDALTADLEPGLYRVSISRAGANVGRRSYSVMSEVSRLRQLNADRQTVARTGAAGIAGYQQRADAATGALHAIKMNTTKLIATLTTWVPYTDVDEAI